MEASGVGRVPEEIKWKYTDLKKLLCYKIKRQELGFNDFPSSLPKPGPLMTDFSCWKSPRDGLVAAARQSLSCP